MADTEAEVPQSKIVQVGDTVAVGALADQLNIPVTKLITELFKNGVMATVNESIDFDTAQIVVGELDLGVELAKKEHEAPVVRTRRVHGADGQTRPPVVAVMGHIDHGKTSLLDAIRGGEVAAGEAGGITQHISAYQIEHGGRKLTFLDTPGHEAFAAIREHGARLTDLAVIVVAADDGIKPQTLEAIRYAKTAGVRMIIAANKVDKPGADINKLKAQLSENQLIPEDFGGDTIVMPVSAKTKEGIPQLLDMILLVADVEELKADATGPAEGLIIESHMETGRGPVAIALIEHGNLKAGDFVQAGGTYGKIRNLETTDGQPIKEAGPSTPVVITGFKALPEFADEFLVVKEEKLARAGATAQTASRAGGDDSSATSGSELLRIINRSNKLTEFNIVLKADAQGSLTSVTDSLKGLDNEEVAARVVSSGIGVISESDIHTAHSSDAVIYGFHTSLPTHIKRLAARDRVSVRLYTVIYELLDDVKAELSTRLAPEVVETALGTVIVKGVFKTTKAETIAGGEVTKGKLAIPALARVIRDKEVIADELEVTNLKSGPTDVKEVQTGEMCGFSLKTLEKLNIAEGDRVELFTRTTKTRTL